MAVSFHVVSDEFALVMVERKSDSGIERKIRRDVVLVDIDLAVLNILRMNKLDLVDHFEFTEEHCAYESVKITSGNKSLLFHLLLSFLLSCHPENSFHTINIRKILLEITAKFKYQ